MHALREILVRAEGAGAAIGHFNVADLVLLKAVFVAAREVKVPVLVGASEGERAFFGIGPGSAIHDHARGLTTADHARRFVESTGIDILAPAVGNMHGMLESLVRGDTRKRLDIDRIRGIKTAARVFLTLHGGSGTNDDDLRNAIAAGINIIHINSELRVAWRRGLEDGLTKHPNEMVPYKILPAAVDAVKNVVRSRLKLFSEG